MGRRIKGVVRQFHNREISFPGFLYQLLRECQRRVGHDRGFENKLLRLYRYQCHRRLCEQPGADWDLRRMVVALRLYLVFFSIYRRHGDGFKRSERTSS